MKELGVFPASTTQIPIAPSEPMPFSPVQTIENAKHNAEMERISSSPEGSLSATSKEANLTTLQVELQQALQHEIALHTVALHREVEGLVISLGEFGFFDNGSATLKSSAFPALDRIASILAVRTRRLRVEGHTDNVPIHTAQMASNWELPPLAPPSWFVSLLCVTASLPTACQPPVSPISSHRQQRHSPRPGPEPSRRRSHP